jgi:hypothetical protein
VLTKHRGQRWVKINFTDSGLSFWCVQITIPMAVPDVQDGAFQVLHLKEARKLPGELLIPL